MLDIIKKTLIPLKKGKFHEHCHTIATQPHNPEYYNNVSSELNSLMTKLDVGQNIKGDFVDKNYESLDERVLTCTDGFYYFGLQVPMMGNAMKSNLELFTSYESSRKLNKYAEVLVNRGTYADITPGMVLTGLVVCNKSQPDTLHINIDNLQESLTNYNCLIIHVQNPHQKINITYNRREEETKLAKIVMLIDAGCSVTLNETILGNTQIVFDVLCGSYARLRHHIQQQSDLFSHYVSNVTLNTGSEVQQKHITWAKRKNNMFFFNNVNHSHKGVYDFTSRTIAQDSSKVHVEGKINVKKHHTLSNTEWNHKGLLLDDDSNISGSPQLNIKTKEVTATHGFAVSEPNEEILNYLISRGIAPHQAVQQICVGHISI